MILTSAKQYIDVIHDFRYIPHQEVSILLNFFWGCLFNLLKLETMTLHLIYMVIQVLIFVQFRARNVSKMAV